jgi:hypothetical protein
MQSMTRWGLNEMRARYRAVRTKATALSPFSEARLILQSRDNSRVAQALLIIARVHSGCFSALGDRYWGGWVLQRFLHFFA